jgi:hypothetical protein
LGCAFGHAVMELVLKVLHRKFDRHTSSSASEKKTDDLEDVASSSKAVKNGGPLIMIRSKDTQNWSGIISSQNVSLITYSHVLISSYTFPEFFTYPDRITCLWLYLEAI